MNTPSREPQPKKLHALFDRTRRFRHANPDSPLTSNAILQQRDWDTLEILHRYRVLDTLTLRKLVNAQQPATQQITEPRFQRRLRVLWRAAFLDRPNPNDQLYLKATGQETHLLWAVGKNGYYALAPRLGLPLDNRQASRQTQKNAEVKSLFLLHALGLGKFRACMELATCQHEELKLLLWKHHNLKATFTPPVHQLSLFHPSGPERTISLVPDGFLGVQHVKEPSPNRSFFFVEYDNGTTPLSRWLLKKGLGYAEYWHQNKHAQLLGIKGFRVLIIAPTPGRQQNMIHALAKWREQAERKGNAYPQELWWFTDKSCTTTFLRPPCAGWSESGCNTQTCQGIAISGLHHKEKPRAFAFFANGGVSGGCGSTAIKLLPDLAPLWPVLRAGQQLNCQHF